MCQAGECIWAEVGWKGEGGLRSVFSVSDEARASVIKYALSPIT